MLDTTDLSKFLKGITDALRTKKGTTDVIEHKLIDEEIKNLPSVSMSIKFGKNDTRTNYNNYFTNNQSRELPLFSTENGISFIGFASSNTYLENVEEFNAPKGEYFAWAFQNDYKLKSVKMDIPKGKDYSSMFSGCWNLETIKETLDFSNAVAIHEKILAGDREITNNGKPFLYMFSGCSKLKDIRFVKECIKFPFDVHWCTELTKESYQSIFDGLGTVTNTCTLTLPNVDAAKSLYSFYYANANQRGWTVVYA